MTRRRRGYRRNSTSIVQAAAPAKKDYGWVWPAAKVAIGVTAAVGIGYLIWKFIDGLPKIPDARGAAQWVLENVPGPIQKQHEMDEIISKAPYIDKWTKNKNGIEVDEHFWKEKKLWQVRVKAPTYPDTWAQNGRNYIVLYLVPDTIGSMDEGANMVTKAEVNKAIEGAIPTDYPILVPKHFANDKWYYNKYGILVDLHQYSKTKLWEVRIRVPTYPDKWSKNDMNYIVVYALPTVAQAEIAASNLNQSVVNDAIAKIVPGEVPVLTYATTYGTFKEIGVDNMSGPVGNQVGNRIVFQNGIVVGKHHGRGGAQGVVNTAIANSKKTDVETTPMLVYRELPSSLTGFGRIRLGSIGVQVGNRIVW